MNIRFAERVSGVTLHCFFKKKQEEAEKKEATLKKNYKNRMRKKKLH